MIFVWILWTLIVLGFLSAGVAGVVWTLHRRKHSKSLKNAARCPTVIVWYRGAGKEKTCAGNDRCTLNVNHDGPHHCQDPNSDTPKDYWWP